jgi:hypothetical protein
MTRIVLTKNPNGGGILPITEGLMDESGGNIAQWPDAEAAKQAAQDHPLIQAWGGWVIDLDYEEVISV